MDIVNRALIERELILSLKIGDDSAFRSLFNLYFGKLYVFAFRFLKNKERAEEIVNDAFLNLWINRAKVNEDLPVLAYLYTIVRRLSLNALRSATSSDNAIQQLWTMSEAITNNTEDTVLLNDLKKFTEKALEYLPPQQQRIFRLSRFDGLSYDEIAAELGISRNTVKNHLVAALKVLRTHFEKSDSHYFLLLYFIHKMGS